MTGTDGLAPPVSPIRRAVAALPWLLPAAVLAVAGVAKLVAPEGTPPRSLEGVARAVSYPVLLRLLGAFEVLVAVQLARPATRRLGAGVATGLLAGFAVLVAGNAHDAAFLGNCGCFGALPSAWSGLGPILARNALLCGLLAMVLVAARRPAWLAPAQAAGVAAIVLLGALALASHRLRAYDQLVLAVARSGENATRFSGLPLPDIALVSPGGERTSSRAALRDHDHVLFFSPDCPHCRRRAPHWAQLDRTLRERGARVVLLATNESSPVADFKAAHGCEEVVHYVVPEPLDPYRWGVREVPQLVVLGKGRRLAYHEGQVLGATFTDSLDLASRRVEGLAGPAWDRIAQSIFGPGAACRELPGKAGDLRVAAVRRPTGGDAWLGVGAARGLPSYALELAFGVERDGTIRGVVPLTASGYARVVDPDGSLYDVLRGRTLADARAFAAGRAAEPTVAGPVWDAVETLLAALADELPAPAAAGEAE